MSFHAETGLTCESAHFLCAWLWGRDVVGVRVLFALTALSNLLTQEGTALSWVLIEFDAQLPPPV